MGIDSFSLGKVGFIKIEVEGHELAVVKGLVNVLARDRPNLQSHRRRLPKVSSRFQWNSFARDRPLKSKSCLSRI